MNLRNYVWMAKISVNEPDFPQKLGVNELRVNGNGSQNLRVNSHHSHVNYVWTGNYAYEVPHNLFRSRTHDFPFFKVAIHKSHSKLWLRVHIFNNRTKYWNLASTETFIFILVDISEFSISSDFLSHIDWIYPKDHESELHFAIRDLHTHNFIHYWIPFPQ